MKTERINVIKYLIVGAIAAVLLILWGEKAHGQALTPASTASDINLWMVAVVILAIALVTVFVLAKMGKLGKAGAPINTAALTAEVSTLEFLASALDRASQTIHTQAGHIIATAAASAAATPAPPTLTDTVSPAKSTVSYKL